MGPRLAILSTADGCAGIAGSAIGAAGAAAGAGPRDCALTSVGAPGGTAAGAPPIGALRPAIGACGAIGPGAGGGGAAISFAAAIEGVRLKGWNCGLPCTGTPVPAGA